MKKFLLRSIAFLLPALLILALAEVYVRSIPCSYKYKDQWLSTHGNQVSTLFLGNSHAFYDLRPSDFADSTFNLSNVSQRLEHDDFLLRQYAGACPNLSRVILVVDNSNLFDVPMEDDEPGRVAYYQLYMHYPLSSFHFPLELAYINSFWKKITRYWEGKGLSCDSLGWGCDYRAEWRNLIDFTPERIRSHVFSSWTSTFRNVRALHSIASWCQQHRISLVLLMPPVTQAYTQKASSWQLEFVNHVAQDCQQRYGAIVLDYSRDRRFTDLDFFDSDHLNDKGAIKFTHILRSALEPC